MIPTLKEYQTALRVVNAYEMAQERLYQLKVDAFRKDLQKYFSRNPVSGFIIKDFLLRDGNIIPKEPCLEEMYNGENNKDIENLCEKHQVKFKMIYWCYHK